MNTGKIFENAIKRSVPKSILLFRLPDAAQSFGGSNRLRFSRKNPFDFLMWDSCGHILFALEMKTVSGKSISFERSSEDHGEIHLHQISGLNECSKYDGIVCGFVIEFRVLATTIFIYISDFLRVSSVIPKKSFTIKDLDALSIPYYVIPQEIVKTRYKYDIEYFVREIRNHRK